MSIYPRRSALEPAVVPAQLASYHDAHGLADASALGLADASAHRRADAGAHGLADASAIGTDLGAHALPPLHFGRGVLQRRALRCRRQPRGAV